MVNKGFKKGIISTHPTPHSRSLGKIQGTKSTTLIGIACRAEGGPKFKGNQSLVAVPNPTVGVSSPSLVHLEMMYTLPEGTGVTCDPTYGSLATLPP